MLKIFTDNIEEKAKEEIDLLLKQEAFKDSKIRIMPDVHAGKGCVIGFTGNLGNKVIPNIVGVDIGCGMLCVELGNIEIDLEGHYREDYLHDMKICQEFASLNRKIIVAIILDLIYGKNTYTLVNTKEIDFEYAKKVNTSLSIAYFETIHNYISFEDNIVRKGAISARKGERVLIPMNMKDGCIIAVGKGNDDWNQSAPHGAGRIMSRMRAKEELDLEDYKKSMQGIYSTSVNSQTLDEAPMVYKPMDEIINNISDTVEIEKIIKPIYNFKASD